MRSLLVSLITAACFFLIQATMVWSGEQPPRPATVPEPVSAESAPVWLWSFDNQESPLLSTGSADRSLTLEVVGKVKTSVAGPRPSDYPDFAETNRAVQLMDESSYLRVKDPGSGSTLDFQKGEAITLACWVRWEGALSGGNKTLIAKGRTHQGAQYTHNQNYALRITSNGSGVFLNFLFSDAEAKNHPAAGESHWHRWTSRRAIPEDAAWHHLALAYVFGQPESLRGYIDGVPTEGDWDMGGPTTLGPVVDDDDLCIGSSMNGKLTFPGQIDEVAIYRRALGPDEIKQRVTIAIPTFDELVRGVDPDTVPKDVVRLEILERVPVARSWQFRPGKFQTIYQTDLFALKNLPRKYNEQGLIVDRPVPSLFRLSSRIALPAGSYELLVRSLDSTRLYLDGELLTETPFKNLKGTAHGPYYELDDPGPNMLSLAAGHQERRVTVTLGEGTHLFTLYGLIGNKGKGDYLGEVCVGIGPPGGPYRFLSPVRDLPFTDEEWLTFLSEDHVRLRKSEQRERLARSQQERGYWRRRHAYARNAVRGQAGSSQQGIDSLIASGWPSGERGRPLIDDYAFLRRVTLDTIGVIPTPEQIATFFSEAPDVRRARYIDRMLEHPGWADHWVGYWQDVLAENPGLTKPELNNTGPFRWFIHESFLDNKPFDRFVSELIMMEGSRYSGGPAGFGIATQNDVPLAAKAHVLGTAFLGIDLKCARCHDAPYHDLTQQDLFRLAAMLKREAQSVPETSSIPATAEQIAKMHVTVSLKPGERIPPRWPFAELIDSPKEGDERPLPDDLIRNPGDTRELLAAQITTPHNRRFAQVIVNRLWKRYLGRGLVEPVDDWEEAAPSHPELLDWLADELISHDYDLKHVARLILNSALYQREPVPLDRHHRDVLLWTGPVQRRMTGEQLLDSLFLASGKDFDSEELTMDRDGKHPSSKFAHLGIPRRAWEFLAVSNERDRVSLNLPMAQSLIDLMVAYNWRHQRQDPLTDREESLTPLQPMALAHGTAAARIIDFSDRSRWARMALEDEPVDRFIERLFEVLLTRPPTSQERQVLRELLAPGYDSRIVAGPEVVRPRRIHRSGITWYNHFDPRSDQEAVARQREVLKGDPPTARLDADWRARAEDAVWALINQPEFVFLP